MLLCILAKLCKYGVPSQSSHDSENHQEIMCQGPVSKQKHLWSQPNFFSHFWNLRSLARMSPWIWPCLATSNYLKGQKLSSDKVPGRMHLTCVDVESTHLQACGFYEATCGRPKQSLLNFIKVKAIYVGRKTINDSLSDRLSLRFAYVEMYEKTDLRQKRKSNHYKCTHIFNLSPISSVTSGIWEHWPECHRAFGHA